MTRTINLSTDIPESREIHITLPEDVPAGPADIVLVVNSAATGGPTLGDVANSEFFGMWRDRPDITDGPSFADDLRARGWKRPA
jgi:hypothetical protein